MYHVTTYILSYFKNLHASAMHLRNIAYNNFKRNQLIVSCNSYRFIRTVRDIENEIAIFFPSLFSLFAPFRQTLPKYRMHEDWLFIGNLCAVSSTEGVAKLKVVKWQVSRANNENEMGEVGTFWRENIFSHLLFSFLFFILRGRVKNVLVTKCSRSYYLSNK